MSGPRVAIVGAGAFGGWTALELCRRGAEVTLIDAWGPGHVRASSGGETRIIRAVYGSRPLYTRMAQRALERWRDHDARRGSRLLIRTGGLWMFGADDRFGRASAAALADAGLPFEWLAPREIAARFPQIAADGLSSALWEPEAGYLLARRACAEVVERVVAEGGVYRQAAALAPVAADRAARGELALADGSTLQADAIVFACGPWLGRLFPDVVGARVTPTRQEVFYFGGPAGDARFEDPALPVWLEVGERLRYGIPGNALRGFKIADDSPGPRFDPTDGDRDISAAGIAAARAYLARRFPAMAAAPYLGGEVCQYEGTPDADFIIDAHPDARRVWIVGGGSGHGFKMGPIIGEIVADAVLGIAAPDDAFRLDRFAAGRTPAKWE